MTYVPSESSIASVTVNSATTVTLIISPATGGVTSPVSGSYPYDVNAQVTITATPDATYYFWHWLKNGVQATTAKSFIFNITSDTTVTPVFKITAPPPDYILPLIIAGAVGVGAIAYLGTRKKQKKPAK